MRIASFLRLKSTSDELLRIDLLRFIASVGIVIYHVSTMFALAPAWLPGAVDGFHVFVDLFFAISGIVIAMIYAGQTMTWEGYRLFLLKRIARIGPLHWATLLFFVTLGLAMATTHIAANDPTRYDMRCFVPQMLLLHAFNTCRYHSFNLVSWSISAEMAMYVAFPIFALLARRIGPSVSLVAIGLAAIMTLALPGWTERTFEFGVLRAIPSFLFGIGLFFARDLLRRVPGVTILYAIVGILFFVASLLSATPILLLALAWLWVALAYAADLSRRPGPLVRRLGPLGQLTYSVYMLHPVFETVGIAIVGQRLLHLSGVVLNIWTGVLFLLIFPIASAISFHRFEMPLRRRIAYSATRQKQRIPEPLIAETTP